MMPFKNVGWLWYEHFQDMWPSARARGTHAVVGGRHAAPATTPAVDSPSTPTSTPTLLNTAEHSDDEMDMNVDLTAGAASTKRKNNDGSDSERPDASSGSIPVSSTLIASESSRAHKATKTSATSTVHSSSTGARSRPTSSIATSSHLSVASSQVPPPSSNKSAGRPTKLNRTDALAEQLRGAIASLNDTMRVTTEDPIAAMRRIATEMINADSTLTNGKRIHILQHFIDNIAYAEVYVAMLDKALTQEEVLSKVVEGLCQ